MLLQKYCERKNQFRDPKVKKKILWTEILNEFKVKGYNVSQEILDRKMRNLKQTYKSIKDNNKKTSTGRGRITWEWFDTMEDLFKEDRTINVGATLSSMPSTSSKSNDGMFSIEEGSISVALSSQDEEDASSIQLNIDNVHSETVENMSENSSCVRWVEESIRGNSYVCNWLKNCTQQNIDQFEYNVESSNNYFDKNVIENLKCRKELFVSYSSVTDISSQQPPMRNLKKEKAVKSRILYNQRKKMLDCEERRVSAINKLCEKLEEHNKIQQERNDILKALLVLQKD